MDAQEKEHVEFAIQVFEREMGRMPVHTDEKDAATVAILALGIRYGRSGILLTHNDIAHLHDTIYNATDRSLTNEQLYKLWEFVPDDIKADAQHWGVSDTPTRDSIFKWIKKHPEILNHFS